VGRNPGVAGIDGLAAAVAGQFLSKVMMDSQGHVRIGGPATRTDIDT
jgi:hypothetical protein